MGRGRPSLSPEKKSSDGIRINIYVSEERQLDLRNVLVRLHGDPSVAFQLEPAFEGEKLLRRGLISLVTELLEGKLSVTGGQSSLLQLADLERLRLLERENAELKKSLREADVRVSQEKKRGPPLKSSSNLLDQLIERQKEFDHQGAGGNRPKSTVLAERSRQLAAHLDMLGVFLCGGPASSSEQKRESLKAQLVHLCSGPLPSLSATDFISVAQHCSPEVFNVAAVDNFQSRFSVSVEQLIEYVDTFGLSQSALSGLYKLVGVLLPTKKSYNERLSEYALLEQAAMWRERCDTGERIRLDRLFELLQLLYPWTAMDNVDPIPLFHFDATNCLRSKLTACSMEFVNDRQAENGIPRASFKHNWVFCVYFEGDNYVNLQRNLGGWGEYFDRFLEKLSDKNIFYLLGFDGAGAHEATGIGDNCSPLDFHLYR